MNELVEIKKILALNKINDMEKNGNKNLCKNMLPVVY